MLKLLDDSELKENEDIFVLTYEYEREKKKEEKN